MRGLKDWGGGGERERERERPVIDCKKSVRQPILSNYDIYI